MTGFGIGNCYAKRPHLGAKLPLRICLETLNTKPSEKMPLKMFGSCSDFSRAK
jgi:hypothetical protein